MLVKLSRSSAQGFAKVELRSMFSEMTFNMVMRMVAGKRYYGQDDLSDEEEALRFRTTLKEASTYGGAVNPGDFLPILNWFVKEGYEKKVKRIASAMDELLQGLIDEHRSDKESRNTMIGHLLSLQQSQPDYYTDQIIKGFIMNILLGGTDTSSSTLEWAMSNLLNNPHILKKARAELDAQVGQKLLVDEPDLSKLHYLQSIISETLRLHPAAPLLVPHYSSDDCTIGGYDVPRGTIVMVNAWAIHRDPKHWDDAQSFKPERFETSEGGGEVNKLMPFGLGRRACPGEGLAKRVVGLGLASLIQCFEWERVGEEEVDMVEGRGLIMPKAVPLEAMCKARQIITKSTSLLESLADS